jgi:hypothetical protein
VSTAGNVNRPLSHRMALPHRYTYIYSHPGIVDAGFDGGNNTMSRPKNFPYAMTLRLTAPMESELENLAYTLRLSKAQFIRIALRRAIADAYEHEMQYTQLQGAL